MVLRTGIVAVVVLLCAGVASAQNDDGHFDASVNIGEVFTKQSTGNLITQSATEGSFGVATFRWKLAPKHSLLVNYGRDKNSQIFQSAFDFHVLTHISEFSAAYMFSPFQKGRFEPFLLAGGGILRFSPQSTWAVLPPIMNVPDNIQVNLGAANQTMPAFLYGGGVDYTLPRFSRFALRLQYRGLFYSNPDFKVTNTSNAVSFFTGTKGHLAEPSLGLVFRF